MSVRILTEDSSREELLEALGHVSREAGRELRTDHLGQPNERWADLHAFINSLLDLLED